MSEQHKWLVNGLSDNIHHVTGFYLQLHAPLKVHGLQYDSTVETSNSTSVVFFLRHHHKEVRLHGFHGYGVIQCSGSSKDSIPSEIRHLQGTSRTSDK